MLVNHGDHDHCELIAGSVLPGPMYALWPITRREARRDATLADDDVASFMYAFWPREAQCDETLDAALAARDKSRDAALRNQTRLKMVVALIINILAIFVALLIVWRVSLAAHKAVEDNADLAHQRLFAASPGAICASPHNDKIVPLRRCNNLSIAYVDNNSLSDAFGVGLTPICSPAVDLNDALSLTQLMSAMQKCAAARFLSEQLDRWAYTYAGSLDNNSVQLQSGVNETIMQYYFNRSNFDFADMHFLPSNCDD